MSVISKFLSAPPNGFSTQIATASVGTSTLSVALDSATGLPTEGIGQFFKKDASGNVIAGSVEFCHWTNVSGNTLTFADTGDRGITGSDSGAQAYVADDYFEVWVSSYYVDKSKASGSDVTTGTSDATIVTPKALADAGIVAPPVTLTNTVTLTNKRWTKKIISATNYTTDTGTSLNCDNCTDFIITAQAGALKFNNPGGTPTEQQTLWIAVTGTGARALTWDTQFEASAAVALPTTTVGTARLDIGFVWIAATSKWRCVASA